MAMNFLWAEKSLLEPMKSASAELLIICDDEGQILAAGGPVGPVYAFGHAGEEDFPEFLEKLGLTGVDIQRPDIMALEANGKLKLIRHGSQPG